MSVLRCERIAAGDFDGAVARIGGLTLARTPEGRFVEIADEETERVVQALAFAGVRASSVLQALAPRPGSRAALGRDLTPLPLDALVLDLVHVRPLSLAAETRRLLRPSPFRPAPTSRRALCRDLLRGSDALIGWRRRAWSTREVLRSLVARRALRAVVFDAGAVGRPPEHRALTRDGALGAWLFA